MSAKAKDFWVERDEKLIEQGEQRGALRAIQRMVVLQGRSKLGPSQEMEEVIRRIADRGRLEAIALRLLTAESWAELMTLPE